MEKRKIKAVVLAAGESTRMKSSKSKIIHKILGKEIINFTLDAVSDAGIQEQDIIIVSGKNRIELEQVINKKINYVVKFRKSKI